MKYNYILLLGLLLPFIDAYHIPFYRKDYTYIEEYDAFYKVHSDLHGISWSNAFLACEDEGALLFYPKTEKEWISVKTLINNNIKDISNITDIFVGLHDEFGIGEYITVDGHTTPFPLHMEQSSSSNEPPDATCVLLNINTGLHTIGPCVKTPSDPLPFLCKKPIDTELCPTIDRDYKYVKSSSKCYKVSRRWKMWDEALQTCYMEGGILVVVENENEAMAIKEFLSLDTRYHVGIRKLVSRHDYYTIKGSKRGDVYNRPLDTRENELECGVIWYYSRYEDQSSASIYTSTVECGERLPYICEIDVGQS